MRTLKTKSGFTLIELTVVIMIILILAAMAVPRFSEVSASARQARCVSNIRTVEQAMLLWENRNNIIYANGWINKVGAGASGSATYDLTAYVKDDGAFDCPMANRAAGEYYMLRAGSAGSYFPGLNCYYYGRPPHLPGGTSAQNYPHTYFTDDPLS